ncbi:Exopolyphosphatase [Dactylella cylindrospora]|nr:Exopolyphosphatase [Dactylella cylindrospora]
MRVSGFTKIIAVTASFKLCSALKIIINNDDGWATANIREFYKALRADGHDVYIVAPVEQQSGQGGRTVFTTEANLSAPGQFDTVPAGAPSFGSDPADSHIWYYNGTPAAVTFFALDYLVKREHIFNGSEPDLFVTGPNEGSNAGPFVFTLSGTVGAAYAAVSRGIPAIAFSATDFMNRVYTSVNSTSDPSTIIAKLGAKVVRQLAENAKHVEKNEKDEKRKNRKLLPYGYGISVNFPFITSALNETDPQHCRSPPFVHTRLTGGAATNFASYNEDRKTFTWAMNYTSPGVNTCINGDCELPGETDVIKKCKTAVSVWTVDYDAPSCGGAIKVRELLEGLVGKRNHTHREGKGGENHGKDGEPVQRQVDTGAAVSLGVSGAVVVLAALVGVGMPLL